MTVVEIKPIRLGALGSELFRARRLVVDTGLHAKGWTREQAIDYMLEQTALSRGNIEAEVNRYITWPGQATAYKSRQRHASCAGCLNSDAECVLGCGAQSENESVGKLPVFPAFRIRCELVLVRPNPFRSAHVDEKGVISSCKCAI